MVVAGLTPPLGVGVPLWLTTGFSVGLLSQIFQQNPEFTSRGIFFCDRYLVSLRILGAEFLKNINSRTPHFL